jgi:hypothetical protein
VSKYRKAAPNVDGTKVNVNVSSFAWNRKNILGTRMDETVAKYVDNSPRVILSRVITFGSGIPPKVIK